MKVGDAVGHYRVTARLGAGGMGEVWLAEHPVVHKRVAVKVLPPASKAAERRFRTEAQALSELRHPGLVELFDYGTTEGGELYFTMEHLEGGSLARVIERAGRMPLPRALRIAADVAEALAAAHERGVVHRDLTPENVLVSEGDRVKVVDFGLAKLLDGGIRTAEGRVMGTVEYMAPEQCEGRSDVDGRADVYALGCLLYELLSGAPPFEGDAAEVARAQRSVAAKPVPGVPPAVQALVARALAKRPGDRFPTMEAMRDALVEVQGGAPRATTIEAGARRRRMGGLAVALGLGALAAAAGAGAWIGLRPPATAPHAARRLTVRSRPAGAQLAVGGRSRGVTPATVALDGQPTEAAVELRLPGFAPWRATVGAEGEVTIDAELAPLPKP